MKFRILHLLFIIFVTGVAMAAWDLGGFGASVLSIPFLCVALFCGYMTSSTWRSVHQGERLTALFATAVSLFGILFYLLVLYFGGQGRS